MDLIVSTGLSKTLDGKVVPREIDLSVRAGEVFGILGANGGTARWSGS